MTSDGSSITNLNAPYGASDAAWSPDGKRIAFEGDPNGDGNLEVFVMNADGSGAIPLTDSPDRDYWPDWFPDARRIAFTSFRDGTPNIYVMNSDGGDQHAITDITDVEYGSFEPDVSPNGKKIVFMRGRQIDPPTLWTIDADGTNLTQLTPLDGQQDLNPQWSPDGREIVFSSNRGGTFEIYIMDADGTNVRQLTASPGADFNPTFSPDGRQIAWWKLRGGQGDVWIMNRDGSDPVNITHSPATEGFPAWQPGHLVQK